MEEFIKTKTGRVLISIVWGLGLAALLFGVCTGPNCVIVQGPDPSDIRNKIFHHDNGCIRMEPVYVTCNGK